jgi:hypothetical protein
MNRWNHLLIGLFLGLLSPLAALFIYLKLNSRDSSFMEMLQGFSERKVLSHVVSLSVIINLLVFFIFIWLHKDRSAKGVLGATIIYGLLIVALKFLL